MKHVGVIGAVFAVIWGITLSNPVYCDESDSRSEIYQSEGSSPQSSVQPHSSSVNKLALGRELTLARLDSVSGSLSPAAAQENPAVATVYGQAESLQRSEGTPEPPVAILVLIGLLGLIIGRRRMR